MLLPKSSSNLLRKLFIAVIALCIGIFWMSSVYCLRSFHGKWSFVKNRQVYFQRKNETAHIDCRKLLHDDKGDYAKQIAASRSKISPRNLSMSCEHVRARLLPPDPLRRIDFGVAYARIVYESYEFLEDELRSSFHPQNVFCYAIDYKADKEFVERVETLAKCFPNVVVPEKRWDIGRNGINGTLAHHECMKALLAYEGWGYVILMQNYDVMIKTVFETVSILRALGGANDVYVRPCGPGRYNRLLDWDIRSLKLYRNEQQMTSAQLNSSLTFAQGAVQASLTRSAVEWMVNTVDLTKIFEQLDFDLMGVDEVLIPTLQVSDGLDMPGRFTARCVKEGRIMDFITRVTSWQFTTDECRSMHYRHFVCIYGVEDLVWVSKSPKLMANKMMPSFDYGAIDCMHELMFNRTYLVQGDQKWNMTLYENLPGVLYNKYRQNPHPGFKLDCNLVI
ncbi:Core-2/I-Branching enzyme [Trichostrongylus colubriformis]|uniref:Core-2/I-Branching enzyme n=1 Tax=Trichostrongylus colubriformis TaxID=6319 RepID=A0AAN8IF77_TRICO